MRKKQFILSLIEKEDIYREKLNFNNNKLIMIHFKRKTNLHFAFQVVKLIFLIKTVKSKYESILILNIEIIIIVIIIKL